MVDLTRQGKFAEKKVISVSAARLKHTDVSSTAKQELFKLPQNCIITGAWVDVKVVGQALLTVDFGFDGGNELGNDLDINGPAGVVGGALSTALATGTGKTVTATFSADPTAGDFVFVVQYIEYDLGTGRLTEYIVP